MTAPIVPNLNDPSVRDRKQGDPNFLWECAFGGFRLALRYFQFSPKSEKQLQNYWVADCRVLEALPDASAIPFGKQPRGADGKGLKGAKYNTGDLYPAGKDIKLKFPVGRPNTQKNPNQERMDNQLLADFIAALFGTVREDPNFDLNTTFKVLADQRKFDDDRLQCWDRVSPNPTKQETKHPQTGEVLASVEMLYPRHRFEAVAR